MSLYTPTTALPAEELCRRLALIEQLHEQWADQQIDDLDPFDMWERIGHALAGGS